MNRLNSYWHNLVTPDFDMKNLVTQIADLTDKILSTLGIIVELDDLRFQESLLNEKQKLAVYRIVQEQCTNIVKYAKANQVKIQLSSIGDLFKMTIADDGVGMDTGQQSIGIGINIKAA